MLVAVGCDRSADHGPLASVRIGFFPNVTHAPAVLAASSGDFARAVGPTPVVTRVFNAGPSLIEALWAGDIDLGYVGPGPAITAAVRSHDRGLRVVAGAAADGVVIVARRGSGITSMADLKGRKLATPQYGNTQDIAARHYLTATLGQTDSNNVLPVPNAELSATMARGAVDAAWVPEPWGSVLLRSGEATLIGQEKDLWPNHTFALTVVVTTPEFLAAHGDVVDRILAVNRAWTAQLSADPGRYAGQLDDALAKLTGHRLPAGVTAAALTRVRFTDDPMPATFAADGRWALDLGFAQDEPDLATLIVSRPVATTPFRIGSGITSRFATKEPRTEGTPEVSGVWRPPLTSGVPSVRGSSNARRGVIPASFLSGGPEGRAATASRRTPPGPPGRR